MGLYHLAPYQILLGEGSKQEKIIAEAKNYKIERRINIYINSIIYGVYDRPSYGSPYSSIWGQYDGRRMGLFRISFNLRRRI